MEEKTLRLTEIGKHLILVDEDILRGSETSDEKIHLIKFKFSEPNKEKIEETIRRYEDTNRFIIGDSIKVYNDILRQTNKKYYVQNRVKQYGIISFFRKNNKVLLSIPSLVDEERDFVLNFAFPDILKNLEILMIEEKDYQDRVKLFKYWKGNVILYDPNQHGDYL